MLLETISLSLKEFILDHPELSAINNEDLLDLQLSALTDSMANDYAVMCSDYLRIGGTSLQNPLIHQIPLEAFQDLFDEATKKRIGADRYITALRMYMGSDGITITPVFQPVYLKWNKYESSTQKDLYQVPSDGNGKFYVFDGKAFVPVSDSDRAKMIDNYTKGSITLVHRKAEPDKPFIQDVDVEWCLFPFQVIYKVIQDTWSNVLFLTNAIKEVTYDSGSPYKHVFVVSGEEVTKAPVSRMKFADRSHLCPPCNLVDFGFDPALRT